jgi:murein DD-endopeptidase MepM/ murein hydrolase activator NlpD
MWSLLLVLALPCWVPPLEAPVTDPFRMPPCVWCPGNRGIEFGPTPGQQVRAVAAGTVTFAGTVAGTRYVVVEHADGLRATYGRLADSALRRGDRVLAGQVVGTTTDRFYFGLRDGETPVDPTPRLGVRTYPTRLVPTDGTPAPSPGPGRLKCRV